MLSQKVAKNKLLFDAHFFELLFHFFQTITKTILKPQQRDGDTHFFELSYYVLGNIFSFFSFASCFILAASDGGFILENFRREAPLSSL